jgi:hypothetical protein
MPRNLDQNAVQEFHLWISQFPPEEAIRLVQNEDFQMLQTLADFVL